MLKMKSLLDHLIKLKECVSEWTFNFWGWFLADVAYTLLPIAVIAAIKALTYNPEDYLYLSPEWSFATIVSFGTAITSLIEVKTEIQHDSSQRIYTGTRMLVLLLIVSVIVLSLVVLREDGLNINSEFLWTAQLGLLVLSLSTLYLANSAKHKQTIYETEFPSDMGRGRYFDILNKKIDLIEKEAQCLKLALTKHTEINVLTPLPSQEIEFWETTDRNKVRQRIQQLQQNIHEINELSAELINSPMPELTIKGKAHETSSKRT